MLRSISLRIPLLALAVVAALGLAAQAGAITSVTLNDCDADGCQGSDLFLSVEDVGGGDWKVIYTINTDGYTGSRDGFNQIGFKAVSDWTGATLDSAPGSWSNVLEAPINANSQCGNSGGGSSKACIFGFVDITAGGNYTFEFTLTGGTLLPTSDWHLGAQYADAAGTARGQIISTEPGDEPPIPEPSAALLFGVGVLVVSQRARRR